MAWFAMVIPFLGSGALWLFFSDRIAWQKLLLTTGGSLVVSGGLIWGSKAMTERIQTSDTEFWTGYIVKTSYDEPWNEMVTRTESYEVWVGTGKSKRKETRTRTVKEVVHHPAKWWITDNNGQDITISHGEFEKLCSKFNSRKFVPLHRNFHSINGNRYEGHWPGDDATLEVVTTTHSYSNRVLVSESVFKFQTVDKHDKESYGLFDYPKVVGYHQPCILGYSDPQAERKLSLLNAKLGKSKQIRVWILVFRDQPLEAAIAQMNYWQGGNKNELVLTIGVDSGNVVTWAYVFSWTEKETLKLTVRDTILEQEGKGLQLSEIVDRMEPQVQKEWERKHFKDFNYLSVEPPLWSTLLIYVLTLGVNVGLSVWVIRSGKSNP